MFDKEYIIRNQHFHFKMSGMQTGAAHAGINRDVPTPYQSICVQVSVAVQSSFLLLHTLRARYWRSGFKCLHSYQSHGRLSWSSCLLGSAWSSPESCNHSGSEPTDRNSPSLSFLFTLPLPSILLLISISSLSLLRILSCCYISC